MPQVANRVVHSASKQLECDYLLSSLKFTWCLWGWSESVQNRTYHIRFSYLRVHSCYFIPRWLIQLSNLTLPDFRF